MSAVMASSLKLSEAVRSFLLNPKVTRNLISCNVWTANYVQHRQYAKPAIGKKLAAGKIGKVGAAAPRVRLEVETDPNKLCNFLCGGNIYKEGSDPPLKPDSEYPEWLWKLEITRGGVPLEELDPDSWQYWLKIAKEDRARYRRLDKLKHKYQRF